MAIRTRRRAVDIRVTLSRTGNKTVTSLGFEEQIPPGWTFQGVISGPAPQLGPQYRNAG
ncbi:MAG: hypothetical protein HC888_08700 [Candidatus Competibacteraceae bacterium]|nr:hypothetical protein [Candidatus Competibacteraceae bacterium]